MSLAVRKIILRSSDGESFEVDVRVALESQAIKHVIEDTDTKEGIPLPNVNSKILAKVIEYCEKHVESGLSEDRNNKAAAAVDDELKAWDAEFVKVDQATLFDLTLAAHYLNIKGLLDLCRTVSYMIKEKIPGHLKKIFGFPTIILRSSDCDLFEVDVCVALKFQIINHIIEDKRTNEIIPLPNVTSEILAKVIEYCEEHIESGLSEDRNNNAAVVDDELKAWDAEFAKVDQVTLFDLILAAHYLNIKGLYDLGCQTVADMAKGKTTQPEIRKFWGIKNDITPEEEEEVRRENQWAFE